MFTTNFKYNTQGKLHLPFLTYFYLLYVLFKICILSHTTKEYI